MSPQKKNRNAKPGTPVKVKPIPSHRLRWRCDPEKLSFDSTASVMIKTGVEGIVGQQSALEALQYGLETHSPGQNIFVRGASGTGRLTLIKRLLEETRLSCALVKDCCFVHNFQQPDRPRFISLPAGRGRIFERQINQLSAFIRKNLKEALSSENIQARRNALEKTAKQQVAELVKPFEEELREAGMRLVSFQSGPVTQTAIFPVVEEQAVPPEEFEQLYGQGKVPEKQYQVFMERRDVFDDKLIRINTEVAEIRRHHHETVYALLENTARFTLGELVREIDKSFPEHGVRKFLGELTDDAVKYLLDENHEDEDFTRLYRVNLVLEHDKADSCAVIAENAPTVRNLLGTIDYEFGPGDEVRASHMGIRAGTLLRADGGYLILEIRDILNEPGAWRTLLRTLRTGKLEIVSPDFQLRSGPSLKPDPIPLKIKVVLIGDAETYFYLDQNDPEFSLQFKVLADFDSVISRDQKGIHQYAKVLARMTREEQLLPFDRTAVAAMAEHGARIAARANRLTTKFGRLADIAREGAFIAQKAGHPRVTGEDVQEAVKRGKRRANLPARHFREFVADGTIRIETKGNTVGQINGLAVLQSGPLTYGFPARITATIGPGTAGVINIEREAALSGAIHTKGFYILSGLLRFLLRTDHPLAFEASVAFEQSYGGIDGDSASGAEICCLLSALTDIPLRQDLAMTGAIDQMGHILAIGAVNEKIEGFYDACHDLGFTGSQGVIIPKANAGDLMLRHDVVETCAAGKFHVYAVETVQEALEVLTGMPAGKRNSTGKYSGNSLLAIAVDRARDYWIKASQSPPIQRDR
ncbi:MAG: AAA family ATPase [Planctomycetes bacterium]|nr:AAA family ATPase [Planctomycetota bacterium]